MENQITDMSEIIHQSIQRLSEEAFLYIDQALNLDNQGQSEQAVKLYNRALDAVNKAVDINCNGPEYNGTKRTKSLALQEKLRITRTQVQSRIDELGSNAAVARALADPPPSYEDATSPVSNVSKDSIEQEFREHHQELNGRNDHNDDNDRTSDEAIEIFCVIEGVQIYFITPDGYVSAPSYPTSLKIFQFIQEETSANRPPAFLQVGDWTYPFLEGSSPSLMTEIGAYIFPDLLSDVEGSAVGVILPESVRPDQRVKFQHLLDHLTCMRRQEVSIGPGPEEEYEVVGRRRTSEQISQGILTAADWISWGIQKGAEKGGQLMQKGSVKLKEHLEPEGKPSNIDPRVKQGLEVAKKASGVAVKVSSCVVNKLGQATMAVGRYVAPHVKKQGEKIIPKSWVSKDSPDGYSKIDGVFEVAGSGLQGFSTVYTSLESAAVALARNIRNETVDIVDHKYGKEAAGVTHTSLSTAGYSLMAAHNFSALGAKAIAKRVAKDAGKALVEEANDQQKTDSEKGLPSSKDSPMKE